MGMFFLHIDIAFTNQHNSGDDIFSQAQKAAMSKPVTIDDIARKAGVSASTVSRVLNGNKHVAQAKRAQVLAAVEHFGFRPNAVAQGLARGRSMTVGVLVQDVTSPFFGFMLAGAEEVLERYDYRPMFASTHWRAANPHEETQVLDLLLERRVDGVLIIGGRGEPEPLRQVAAQLPLVAAARQIDGLENQCMTVDNIDGAYRATRYLIGLGHRRIAHITGIKGHPDAVDRFTGYGRALEEAGLHVDQDLVAEGDFEEASGLAGLEQLLTRGVPFTALFAANDQIAYGAILGLHNHGFHVPEDVSVVGFDDLFHSAYTLPPLTTVRQPTRELGAAAASALMQMIEGNQPERQQFATELVIRKSARHVR